MWLIKKMLIKCKWKTLRHLVKKRKIEFRKMMVRMYHIQELEKLGKYDKKELVKYPYKKTRRLFINEFPNEYLHNPEIDI
jgi:hypothetical protein